MRQLGTPFAQALTDLAVDALSLTPPDACVGPAPDSCTSSSGAEFVDTDLSPSSREVLSAMSTAGSSSKATHKTTKRTKTTT